MVSIQQLSSWRWIYKERLQIVFHSHPETRVAVRRIQGISHLIISIPSEVEPKLALITPVDVVVRIFVPVECHTVGSRDFLVISRGSAFMGVPVHPIALGTVEFAYTFSNVGRGVLTV